MSRLSRPGRQVPSRQGPGQSRAGRLRAGAAVALRLPATLALLLVLTLGTLLLGGFTGGASPEALARVGVDLADIGTAWWTPLLSAFTAASWWGLVPALLVTLVGVGVAERVLGAGRVLAIFAGGAVVSALALVALTFLGTLRDDGWLSYLGQEPVVGPYGGAAATLGAATAGMGALWRHRWRTWLLALALMAALFIGVAETLLLLIGGVGGIVLGSVLHRAPGPGERVRRAWFVRPSLRESRFLLATIVGVFALGPVLAHLTGTFAVGPLSAAASLMLQGRPDADEVQELCSGNTTCMSLQEWVGVSSVGAVLLSLVPVVLLLLCAEGLRRGRRLALWAAVVINALIAAVVTATLLVFLVDPAVALDTVDAGDLLVYVLPSAVAPAALAVLLVLRRAEFAVRSGPAAARTLLRRTALLAGVLIVAYTVAWFAEGNLGRAGVGEWLLQLTHLLIPFPLPFVVLLPQGLLTTLLYGFGGAILWLSFGVLVLTDLRRYRAQSRDAGTERDRVRALLQTGGGALSWMALWERNVYWYGADARTAVAYQVHHGVALTVAGPFGAPAAQAQAARDFTGYCVEQGLIPCFYSASEEVGQALDGLHFERLEVAEETILPLAGLAFTGKEWQNVRTALNRAQKLGITDLWGSYAALPPGVRAQVAVISEEWVAEKTLPEMGFTLGGLAELQDPDVLCCVAVDATGLVHGVTSWLPVYTDQQISSWTLDFMRRRSDGFKGVMEFLIASAITHFREQVPSISLSGSPLSRSPLSEAAGTTAEASLLDRLLGLLGDALEPMYGFKSLAAFKSRFQPTHRTLFLFYNDPLALPAIGRAVTAAYLPELSARQSAGFLLQLGAQAGGTRVAG